MISLAYIGIGSNKGDKYSNISVSECFIEALIGSIFCRSKLYVSDPWGFDCKDTFLNKVIGIQTSIEPERLLKELLDIEKLMGRCREKTPSGYVSRIIDLDILFYNNEIINEKALVIPHPLISQRKFVLLPMCDIAPDFIHPSINLSMLDLLAACKDETKIERLFNAVD